MKTDVIIVAAGMGTRLKARRPKALIRLAGQPLFLHSLKVFLRSPKVRGIILVVPRGHEKIFQSGVQQLRTNKKITIVIGGNERNISVRNGLAELSEDTDLVLIHDAARPLVSVELITRTIAALKKDKAVTVAIPVKPTIKRVDPETGYVEATLDRRFLWDIQTPQGFHKELIVKAHQAADGEQVTDDAFLVERLGEKVKVIPGEERNIKITIPEDVVMATTLLSRRVLKVSA